MSKIIRFGENVEGYTISVLNEREIRASAGILFLVMLFSIQAAGGSGNFTPLKYAVTFFLVDMLIRVFINPMLAPTLILGRFIVRNQTPEYVGAQQKKFAWYIGISLAVIMFIHLVILNGYSPITGIICFICLIFLFFESAFGICLGCKVYPWIYKEKAQYCPGEICEIKDRHDIQKISGKQWLILLGFIVFIVLVILLFNEFYAKPAIDLFGLEEKFK